MNLNNKRILLTGGSSGIGKATAQTLIEKGAKVVVTGRDEAKLNKVAESIGAIPLAFDVSNFESLEAKAAQAVEMLGGGIDVLINNAGFGVFPELEQVTLEDLQSVYNTNVFGLALLTKAVVPHFKKQGRGDIINIGSTAAQKGFARGTIYAASKFAVRGMTQSWAAELRPHNIRVILVNPSEVATAFFNEGRQEREEQDNKLGPLDIAHTIVSALEMRDKGFIPEVSVWATNPF